MKKITFTKMMTVNCPPIEVENWPGYRISLPNLPGINLVLAHRTAKYGEITISRAGWGVYDEESGFYLGIHGPTRTACFENAIVQLGYYTPESYVAWIRGKHIRRTTAILTGGAP